MMKNLILAMAAGNRKRVLLFLLLLFLPVTIFASEGSVPKIGPIRVEFIIFGLILVGVALFHRHTFWVAVTGLTVLLIFKFAFDPALGWASICSAPLPSLSRSWIRI